MIGLEYICNLFNKQYKDVAEELGISPQAINSWIKGKRMIPKAQLPRLSKIFNIPEKYFRMKLTELHKLEIQMIRLENEWIEEEYEDTMVNEETGEEMTVTRVMTDHGQEMHMEVLRLEIEERKMINRIEQTINKELHYYEELTESNFHDNISETHDLLRIYKLFVETIENKYITKHTLINLLKAMNLQKDKIFDSGEFTNKIANEIKQEEDRVTKNAEEWMEKVKEFNEIDDLL